MADDIDIEEHDVMDNPAIKNMFPDLSIVKRELVGFGTEESPTKSHRKPRTLIKSPKIYPSHITDDEEDTSIISEPIIKHCPIVTSTQLDKEYKPKLLCLDDEVAEDIEPEAIEPKPIIELDDKSNDSDSQFIGNKIILGKKPANLNTKTTIINTKQDPEMEKCLSVKVVVEDLDGVLMKSKAYCFQCMTLFPDVKAHNAHKKLVHSSQQLAESGDVTSQSSDIDGNKFECDICYYSVTRLYNLRRHYRSKHYCEIPEKLVAKYKSLKANKETLPKVRQLEQSNKTVGQGPVDRYISSIVAAEKLNNVRKKPPGTINKDNICNHCNNTFPTKEELISHLYNILKPKTLQCPACPFIFEEQEDLDKHSLEHSKINSQKVIEVSIARNTRKRKAKLSENEDSQDSVVIMDEYPKTTRRRKLETPDEPDNAPSTSIASQDSVVIMDEYPKTTRRKKLEKPDEPDNAPSTSIASQDSVVIMGEYPKTTRRKKIEKPDEPDNATSTSVAEQTDISAELLKRVIPISTLFKCPSCCFHFLTYISVVNHEKKCRKTKRTGKFQCEDCVITFDGPVNYKIHRKQHFHTNEFNIIPVKFGVDMTNKILCHCPKCGVHYSEQKFWSHFEHCEDDTPKSTYCRKCDILIDDGINDAHSDSHQGQNTNNFIFIDFEEVTVTKTASKKKQKRKRSDDSDEDYQIADEICVSDEEYKSQEESFVPDECNSTNSNDYCYCNTCNCYFPVGYKQVFEYHAKKTCQDLELSKKFFCKQCGIMMTSKTLENHRPRHVQNNYMIFDSNFYNLNGEIINPPVPRFKYCGECKVFYIHLKQGVHVCNRDSKNTKYCNKCECTYSEMAYSLHINFHAYSEKHPNNKYDDICGNGIKYIRYNKKYFGKRKSLYNNEDGSDDGNDKEEVRRLKYTFWQRNVRRLFTLFQCSTCEVMVTEGNVEAHMNIKYNCDSVKNMYKKCEDCDFAIAGKDLKDHLLYHTMNREFNRDQIKIIPFDKAMAVEIDEIETISDAEVYFSDDDVDEDRKYIFYQCRNCKCNLTKGCEKLKYHKCYVSPKIKKFERQRECPLCKLSVNTHTLARHYEWHKINRDVTHSNMKIIKFGKKDTNTMKKSKQQPTLDVSFTQKEKETVKEAKNSNDNKNLAIPQDSNQEENIRGDKLYQCKSCKLNYYNERVVTEHACEKKIPYRCLGCKYTFDRTEYEKHIKFHLNPDYTRASIKTVLFDKNSKVEHVVTKLAAQVKHVSATKPNIPTHSNEKRAIHSHENSTTNSNDRQIALAIDDVQQTETNEQVETIYKCSCGLHFLTKQSAVHHNNICGPKIRASKQNCTKCHLLFTPNVLFDHLMNHHGNKKSEFKFKVIEVSQMLETKDTLYACAECELLFIEKSTMAGHARRCGKKKYVDGKNCMQCGLNFYNEDISFHEMKHHNKTNLEENDFDIVVLKLEDYIQNASKPSEELEDTDPEDFDEDDKANDAEKRVVEPCEPVMVGPSSYNNVIYKCKKCNLCYLNFGTFQGHVVYEKHKHPPKKKCSTCGYVFTEVSLIKHKQVHHDILNLAREDFIVEYNHLVEEKFTISNKLKTKIDLNKKYGNVLYKCTDCVIYFMLENSAHQHVKSFHLTFKTTKQCNICKLNFSLNSLARHNYLHHEKQNLQPKDIEIVEYPYKKEDGSIQYSKSKPANKWNVSDETLRNIMVNKFSNKVYQCDRCDVNFVTKAALESHVNTQNHKYLTLRSECDVCGLKFLEPSLARHIYIHHENMKCKLENLEIVTEIQPSQRRKKKQKVDPKLYKCKPCDNYFMTLETCKSHTFYTHQPVIKEKILSCEICNLNFLKPSLRKHKQLHHVENNFTLKDLIIEEYEPMPYTESGHLPPKVETYIAVDRINANTTDEYQEISSVENGDSLEGDDKTSEKDSLLTPEVPEYVQSDEINGTPAHVNSEQNNQSPKDNIENNTRDDKDVTVSKSSCVQNMQLPTTEQKYNKNLSENTETKVESKSNDNRKQQVQELAANKNKYESDFSKEDVSENNLTKDDVGENVFSKEDVGENNLSKENVGENVSSKEDFGENILSKEDVRENDLSKQDRKD